MWDKLLITIVLVAGAGIVAYLAARQWKLKYRDELRIWLSNHSNTKFKKIGLKIVLTVETAIVLAERITVDIFGRTDSEQTTIITTKTLTFEEAKGMGLIKNNAVQKKEVELYNESEILAMMSCQ